jgi:hypothetical protein
MSCNGTVEVAIGSVHALTGDLLVAIAQRSGEQDPAMTAARHALEIAIAHAEVLVSIEESAEVHERYEEVRGAARAVLASMPTPSQTTIDTDRRSNRRDTQPQSPRALRGSVLGAGFSTGPATEPSKATNR